MSSAVSITEKANDATVTLQGDASLVGSVTPTNVSAALVSLRSGIRVSWDDIGGESGYRVERSTDQASWTTVSGDLAANVTSYTDTDVLQTSDTYYFRVFSFNSDDEVSEASSTVSETTVGPYRSEKIPAVTSVSDVGVG